MEAGSGLLEFIEHVEELSKETATGADGFAHEFAILRQQQFTIKAELPRDSGIAPFNAMKNRYRDIIPYDHCRVQLPALGEPEDDPGVDYINASHIKDSQGRSAYIAAQGPLSHTTDDFWRMIWANDAKIVVMACNIIEANRYKCSKYWSDVGDKDTFGLFEVATLSEDVVCQDFTKRTLQVTYNKEKRIISNYHYISWPDHGVPDSPESVMQLVQSFRQEHEGSDHSLDGKPPIVIHCSAGCGRTGTLIAIDTTLRLLNKDGLFSKIDLYNTVLELRRQRIAMVQTREQLSFVYKAICEVVKAMLAELGGSFTRDTSEPEPVQESAYVNISLMRRQIGTDPQRQRALTVIGKRAAEAETHVTTRRKVVRPMDFDEDGVVDEDEDEDSNKNGSKSSALAKPLKSYEKPLLPVRGRKPMGARDPPACWTWKKKFLV